ncbi:MAG: hypothetical protein M3519_05095 [Actinomycetota bacterium]|jgi:hypothetical protein|nr:hypothetical protein [Actinomycetota bacterium]
MTDVYTWTYCDASGEPYQDLGLSGSAFPSQGEAEAWLSEEWTTLADAGVASVTLMNGDEAVYGPMSLSSAD